MACYLCPVSSCCSKTHPIDLSCTVKYRIKGLPGTGRTNTGAFVRYFFHFVECYLTFFIPLVRIVLLEYLEYGITLGSHLRDEPSYVVEPSHKAFDFLLGLKRRQVLYRSYYVRINLNSFLVDHES